MVPSLQLNVVDAAEDEKELIFAINVTGTENVAKASEKYGATRSISQQTTSLMGRNPSDKNGVAPTWDPQTEPDVPSEWVRNLLKA